MLGPSYEKLEHTMHFNQESI